MAEHWQHLQDIFDEICALDEDRRRVALDQQCNGDDELRAEVLRLLCSYDQERAANAEGNAAPEGRRFGAWETIRLLARGGMGEVWLPRAPTGNTSSAPP